MLLAEKKNFTRFISQHHADGIIGSKTFVFIYSLLVMDYLLFIVIAEATDKCIFIGWF